MSDDVEREPSRPNLTGAAQDPDRARLLFRYLGGEEWQEYRSIMRVLAGTFFAEFSPDDVADQLQSTGDGIEVAMIAARLESLRQWGNVAVSTSVGNPASLADYYKRRHRYLITQHGQEVHDLVEEVLSHVDQVGDVQAGRLRDLHRALQAVAVAVERGLDTIGVDDLSDAVRAVFDPHQSFTTEITQFFAALNQWQSKYDLDADQVQFFAEVLVGYVSEQLTEIERMARPLSLTLRNLAGHVPAIVDRIDSGLARRVESAGLAGTVNVRRPPGSTLADWEHLAVWFSSDGRQRSRIDDLTRQALAAVSTLTKNVTRLSRMGTGSVSRRGDYVRLAGWFDGAVDVEAAHDLSAGAFGMFPSRHLGLLASDADDPLPSTTSWVAQDGPRAVVPVSLRERGEAAARGRPSPIRDRSADREHLRFLRQVELHGQARSTAELLAASGDDGSIDDVDLSQPAFDRLRDLIGQAASRRVGIQDVRWTVDRDVRCTVIRSAGDTTVRSPEGALTLMATRVVVVLAGSQPAAAEQEVEPASTFQGVDR